MFFIEAKKAKRETTSYVIVFLFVVLNVGNGALTYIDNLEIFKAQSVSWIAVWGQAGLLWSFLFLPLAVSIYCANLCSIEKENNNWQRLVSYDLAYKSYIAKFLRAACYGLAGQILFAAGVLGVSLFFKFTLEAQDIAAILVWLLMGYIGVLSLVSLQLYLGIFIKSYSVHVGVGLIGGFSALMLDLLTPVAKFVYPYSQIAVGMHVRELSIEFDPVKIIIFTVVNLFFILMPLILAYPRLQRIKD